MLTDIEIAKQADIKPISDIAEKLGISADELEFYGKYKAKLPLSLLKKYENKEDGKLILVTAINPTPAGEGKTTVTVGLGEAMNRIGKKAVIALREPSMGPVFGIKGGAAGGGYAQVIPMEDINLHFTGDMHAITAANNLLCAIIDNHIQQGNELRIDPRRILFKRCLDMNDRALRNVVIGLGGKVNGVPREDGFMITVASEIMAILCLSSGIKDLKDRLGSILTAYTYDGTPVYARDLNAVGSMAALLKDAIKPNLVQTLEHTPAIVHGGPFANIAHGCNSIVATKLGLKLGDIVVTEAGFGADLGAEKFLDIKCRYGDIFPDAIVIVATLRALKMHGGVPKQELNTENVEAVTKGFSNLQKAIENMRYFNVPVLVAINKFASDTDAEIAELTRLCDEFGVPAELNECWEKGGEGGTDMAKKVVELLEGPKPTPKFVYELEDSLEDKVNKIVKTIYGGDGVIFTDKAKKQIKQLADWGLDRLPVCMAKTQYSLSDNPALLGAPTGFTITVSDIRVANGAGFIVCRTGDVMVMPGLPKRPAALNMDIEADGTIKGLF